MGCMHPAGSICSGMDSAAIAHPLGQAMQARNADWPGATGEAEWPLGCHFFHTPGRTHSYQQSHICSLTCPSWLSYSHAVWVKASAEFTVEHCD